MGDTQSPLQEWVPIHFEACFVKQNSALLLGNTVIKKTTVPNSSCVKLKSPWLLLTDCGLRDVQEITWCSSRSLQWLSFNVFLGVVAREWFQLFCQSLACVIVFCAVGRIKDLQCDKSVQHYSNFCRCDRSGRAAFFTALSTSMVFLGNFW